MPTTKHYTTFTPIPSHVPRQLAIDMLHSHGEIIELNPLVLEHHPIKAPRDAPADEFFSVWHEITERLQYVPGMGKLGSGKISFKGVFHDMPWGLQTHIYAPAGVETRQKWQIRGNQPGEPPEQRELGSGAPAEGLYLREDAEIKCNFAMQKYVQKENKKAAKILVDRLIKKAELIDAEILRQMMSTNTGTGQRDSQYGDSFNSSQGTQSPQPPNSPGFSPSNAFSPNMTNASDYKRNTMLANSEVLRKREEQLRQSFYSSGGSVRSNNGYPSPGMQQSQPSPGPQYPNVTEVAGDFPQQSQQQSTGLAIEMMGDTQFMQPPQPSPGLQPPRHQSTYSELSSDHGGRGSSRPSSVTHETMSSGWGGSQASGNGNGNGNSPMVDQNRQSQNPNQYGSPPQQYGGQQQQQQYSYNQRPFAQELPSQQQR